MAKDNYNSRFGKTHTDSQGLPNAGLSAVSQMAAPNGAGGGVQIQFYHIATKQRAEFPAFITAFSDSYSSNWDSKEVMGRMDPIMNFKNTQRTVTLGFEVPSIDQIEAMENMAEINRLIQFLYPTYTKNGSAHTMNGPPLVKIQFKNLIASGKSQSKGEFIPDISINAETSGLIAAITSLSATPDFNVGSFGAEDLEIEVSAGEFVPLPNVGATMNYPKLWTVDLSFTVLHDHSMDANFRNAAAFPYYISSREAWNPALAKDKNAGTAKKPEKEKPSTNPNVKEPQPEAPAKSGESPAAASTGKKETQKQVTEAQEKTVLESIEDLRGGVDPTALLDELEGLHKKSK
jgi:hypothetical protein